MPKRPNYHRSVMSGILETPHDVRDFAARGGQFNGKLPLARLPRLAGMLASAAGEVDVQLAFTSAEDGVPRVDGHLRAGLEAACQRCLEPVKLDLALEVHLALVDSEEEGDRIHEPYEPWVDTGAGASLAEALEDELLLAVPLAPMHAPDACGGLAQRIEALPGADKDADTRTPFAGLKDLLRAQTRD